MRIALVFVTLLTACGGEVSSSTAPPQAGEPPAVQQAEVEVNEVTVGAGKDGAAEGCADVIEVRVVAEGDRRYTFHVTVRSADVGWEKYADEWTVRGPDQEVLGTRTLLHPHVDEQPFTRSLDGVEVGETIDRVTVAARDSVGGYCGATMEVGLP